MRLAILFERSDRTCSEGRFVRGRKAENDAKSLLASVSCVSVGVCNGRGMVLRAFFWRERPIREGIGEVRITIWFL